MKNQDKSMYTNIDTDGRNSSFKFKIVIVIFASLTLVAITMLAIHPNSTILSPASFQVELESDYYYNLVANNGISRSLQYSSLSDDEKQNLFTTFLEYHSKSYDSSEVDQRYLKFKESLQRIDERNQAEQLAGGSAIHGITRFSDLSDEEFASIYLTASPSTKSKQKYSHSATSNDEDTSDDDDQESNASESSIVLAADDTNIERMDWTGILVTEIQDQGYCGSCWAYSAVNQLQSDAIREGLVDLTTNFSVQQLISCDDDSYGCNGGWTETALDYVQKNGLELDSDYPYTSYYDIDGTCKASKKKKFITISDYVMLTTESEMIDYVKTTGPLSVCVDGTDWATYVEGVMSSCGSNVNHCVQLIGYDAADSYWLIRNSWGTYWGEAGYIRLSLGQNTCAITTDPIYTNPVLYSESTSEHSKQSSSDKE